ncbi:MAG: HepT-like ribonuclease domain-containing protein [Galactobacter sp.]
MTGRSEDPKSRTDVRGLLLDLLEHGAQAQRLVGRGKAAYRSDEMLRLAAESILLRCGEVVARIDNRVPSFSPEHPELELRQLKDSRNVVDHGYDIVYVEIVWTILSVHLPKVMKVDEDFFE